MERFSINVFFEVYFSFGMGCTGLVEDGEEKAFCFIMLFF